MSSNDSTHDIEQHGVVNIVGRPETLLAPAAAWVLIEAPLVAVVLVLGIIAILACTLVAMVAIATFAPDASEGRL